MSNTNITTEMVKELRDATGISVMQCRKALSEAGGDMDKAVAILKKTSADIALKKADRVAKDGRVVIVAGKNQSLIIPLHCETDFVSKNEDFVTLLDNLAKLAADEGLEKMKQDAKTLIDPVIQKTGEKIELGETSEIKGGVLGNYVHAHKAAVVVALEGGNPELARDVAMHVAAMKPEYVSETDIPAEAKNTMKEVFEKEIAGVDKPAEIKEKMLQGKIATYFKEKTLLEQQFIKNPEETVGNLLDKAKAKIKEVKRFSI